MPIVTKSELADILLISRARISQFLKMGLPERDDGRIDLDAALHWVARNIEPDALGGASVVASELLRGQRARPAATSRPSSRSWAKGAPPNPPGFAVLDKIAAPTDRTAVLSLLVALTQIGAKASIAAHAAGAERSLAERTGQIMTALFSNFIEGFVTDHDMLDPAELTFPHQSTFDEVNWPALGPPGEFARPITQSAD